MSEVHVHIDIAAALDAGRPVVALETAVLTHGLPRSPLGRPPRCQPDGWRADKPANLETFRAMQRAVAESGSLPAVIGVHAGSLCVGLHDRELEALAHDTFAEKASARDLAPVMSRGSSAGTTVSATLVACAQTQRSPPTTDLADPLPGIRVFATGGIGGVHRRSTGPLDVSADLIELSRSPVCVVCCGPKAILDVPATAEALESLGVVVVGYQTDTMPRFYSPGDASLQLRQFVTSVGDIAAIGRTHWRDLDRRSAVLVVQNPPAQHAIPIEDVDAAITQAVAHAAQRGVSGSALTPFLLEHVARITEQRSLQANIALLINNARLAGEIARDLAAGA